MTQEMSHAAARLAGHEAAVKRGRPVGGRFIRRGRLLSRSLYWIGWLALARRPTVTSGVERELDELGVGALRLVVSASVLLGLIATFQIAYQLQPYGAAAMSARTIGWFTARELGPLSVAILVIARSSAGIAGELASMSANGEIDALRAMGLDPVKYLVAPKLAALLVALPALGILADVLIPLGGWLGSTFFLGYSTNFVLNELRDALSERDLVVGIAKSLVFALVIVMAAADEGLSVGRRLSAIGSAAVRAVVFSLLGVLATDTLVNAVFYFIPRLL